MPIHIIFLSQTMQRSLALAQKTVTLEEGLLKVLVQIYSSKKTDIRQLLLKIQKLIVLIGRLSSSIQIQINISKINYLFLVWVL